MSAVDDGCGDTARVAVQFDLVRFAGVDERCEHGSFLGTGVMTKTERVLSL